MEPLASRLALVRQRIANACTRCGRAPSAVTLAAVTKGVSPELIQGAVALGLTDIGENRVQEARAKQAALGSRLEALNEGLQPVRWHLIGHLQRNKAKDAVELFDVIHSIDSMALVDALERQAGKRANTIQVFIQVNVSGEATKHGVRPEDIAALGGAIQRSALLSLTGLMTMAPYTDDPERTRPTFRRLRELRDALQRDLTNAPTRLQLSMGMSNDFEVAIEEGANLVRIGTALFGTRDTGHGT